MEFAIAGCCLVFVGYVLGLMRNDANIVRQIERQKKRGDYWFDKYQEAVRDGDWEYVGEWRD